MDKLDKNISFVTPIYKINKIEWVSDIIKATDKYIDQAYKTAEKDLERKKELIGYDGYKKVEDHGMSYHSDNLVGVPELRELEKYIGQTAFNLLDEQGYDMSLYDLFFTEFWVQEFSKNGGGHHDTHTHYDNHISGFYFLKCSKKTSFPVFHDPRFGLNMARLKLKENRSIDTIGNEKINYIPNPGDLIFFNSYLPHQFTVDDGLEDFRFIHFNLQAIRKFILNSVRK